MTRIVISNQDVDIRAESGSLTLQNSLVEIESTGVINVAAVTNYETLVTADDDIPNKKYVDDNSGSGDAHYVGEGTPTTTPTATGTDALAMGDGADAGGEDSIAIGSTASAQQLEGIAIGNTAVVTAPAASEASGIAIGASATVDSDAGWGIAIGKTALSSDDDAIAIGHEAQATGSGSVAIGGDNIVASAPQVAGADAIGIGTASRGTGASSVAIGDTAVAVATNGVAIGHDTDAGDAAGDTSAIAIGNAAQSTAVATIAIGSTATASADNAVAIGDQAEAANIGEFSFSAGQNDHKASHFVCHGQTTDATQTNINPDGSVFNRMILPADTVWAFEIWVACREDATEDAKVWRLAGAIKRDSASATTIIGTVAKDVIAQESGASAWDVAVTADNTNEALQVAVTGEAAHTIDWSAKVMTVQVQ